MKEFPLVSAIVPSFNRGARVVSAIESILAQDYAPIEILVIDDGSSDDTLDRLRRFSDRITLTQQTNQGAAAARNRGLEAARGQFIAFLDSDDRWLRDKTRCQVETLFANPDVGFVASDAQEIDDSGQPAARFLAQYGAIPRQGCVFSALATQPFALTSTVMLRRECLAHEVRFDERLLQFQDIEFFLRLNLKTPIRVMEETLVERGIHAGNISKQHRSRFFYRALAFDTLLTDGTPLDAEQRTTLQHLRQQARARVGEAHFGKDELAAARSWYAQALGWNRTGASALARLALTFLSPARIAWLRRFKRSAGEDL